MSSPRGLVVGGMGGMSGTGATVLIVDDDGVVVPLDVVLPGVGDGVRRIGTGADT